MGPADVLSQKDQVDTNDDNQEVTVLKRSEQHFHIHTLDTALTQKISQASMTDPVVTKALAAMNDEEGEPWIPQIAKEDWTFKNGSLYCKHQLYIPELARHDLVKSLHELPTGGHEEVFCTLH